MYYDNEYYEAHGITEELLRSVDEYLESLPPEPTYEEIELYMEALMDKMSDYDGY